MQKARNYYTGLYNCRAKEELEHIFPQLKESEDEKIIKWIIGQLALSCDDGEKLRVAREWLEKQKESLHIPESCKENADSLTSDEPTPSVILDEQGRVFATQQKEQKPKNILTDDDSLQTAYLKGQTDVLEDPEAYGLQKEQKPAEWSEEDEHIIGRLRSVVNQLASYTDSLDVNGDYCEGDYARLDAWLKSLRPSWKPSEEQMGALNYAYCELFKREDVGHNILGPLQKLCDELKKQM